MVGARQKSQPPICTTQWWGVPPEARLGSQRPQWQWNSDSPFFPHLISRDTFKIQGEDARQAAETPGEKPADRVRGALQMGW